LTDVEFEVSIDVCDVEQTLNVIGGDVAFALELFARRLVVVRRHFFASSVSSVAGASAAAALLAACCLRRSAACCASRFERLALFGCTRLARSWRSISA